MGHSGKTRRSLLSDSMLLDWTFRRSPTFAPMYCLIAATGFAICWAIIHLTVPQIPEHLEEFEKQVPSIVFQAQTAGFTAVLLVNGINVAFSRDPTRYSCNWLLVLVNLVALVTHLLVSLNLTPVVLGPTGVYFHPLRYCCWSFSTPTLLVLISSLSDISPRQLKVAVASDVIMILTGLAAVWTTNTVQAVNTFISFVAFIPVLWYMSLMFDSAIHATEDHATRVSLRVLSGTCIFVWSAFPTVWLLAFCHWITPEQEQIGLGLCDFIAKAVFSSQLWQGNVMTIQQRTEIALRAWQESNSMLIMHKLRKLLTARDVLVHSLSHELQTPIKGIVALTTDLLKVADSSPKAAAQDQDKAHRTHLSTIRSSAVCVLDIIASALDAVSNPVPQQMLTGELVRLQPLIAGVLHLVTPLLPTHIQLANEVPADLPCVDSNRRALMRVLLNMTGALIQNPLVNGRVVLTAKEEENYVVVQVLALDVVLEEDCLHKLLYPFTPGAGYIMSDMTGDTMAANPPLFLFLLRNFLESHAPLSAKATPQNGTTFSFRLPIAEMDGQSVSSTQTADLILPDNTDMRLVAEVQRALRTGRLSTDSARSQSRAQSRTRARHSPAGANKDSPQDRKTVPQDSSSTRQGTGQKSDAVRVPASTEIESCQQAVQDGGEDDPVLAAWHQQHFESLLKKHTEGVAQDAHTCSASASPHSTDSERETIAQAQTPDAHNGEGSKEDSSLTAEGRQAEAEIGPAKVSPPSKPGSSELGSHTTGNSQATGNGQATGNSQATGNKSAVPSTAIGTIRVTPKASALKAREALKAAGVNAPSKGSPGSQQEKPAGGAAGGKEREGSNSSSGSSAGKQLRRSIEQVMDKVRTSLEAVMGHSGKTNADRDGTNTESATTTEVQGHTTTTTTITTTSTITVSTTDTTTDRDGQGVSQSSSNSSRRVSMDSRDLSLNSRRSSLSKWRNEKGVPVRRAGGRASFEFVQGTPGYSGRTKSDKVHPYWMTAKPKMLHRQKYGVIQVLCVDDNIINQLIAETVLKSQHWKVIKAMSGEQALDYVLNKAEVLPDILLLDVMMPGINGFDTCARLREFFPSSVLPVMMLTTSMGESNIVEGFKCGADDYVAKPYKRAELTSRIRAHLRARDDIHELHDHLSTWQLLHNLLPTDIKAKLKAGVSVVPARRDAAVLVVHICDVSYESSLMPPSRMMMMLNQLLTAISKICAAHDVQLLDFCGSGCTMLHILDEDDDTGPCVEDVVQVGVEILQRAQPLVWPSGKALRLQMALHCGPATVGLVEQGALKYILVGEAMTLAEQLVQAVPPCGFFVSHPVVTRCSDTTLFTDEPVAHSPSGVACYLVKSPRWQAALDEISSREIWPLKAHSQSPPHVVQSAGMLQSDIVSSPRIPAAPAADDMTAHAVSAALVAQSLSQYLAASAGLPVAFPVDAGQVNAGFPVAAAAGVQHGVSLSEVMGLIGDPSWTPPATLAESLHTATAAVSAAPGPTPSIGLGAVSLQQPSMNSLPIAAVGVQPSAVQPDSTVGLAPSSTVAPAPSSTVVPAPSSTVGLAPSSTVGLAAGSTAGLPPWMSSALLPPSTATPGGPAATAYNPSSQVRGVSTALFEGAVSGRSLALSTAGRDSTDSNYTADGSSSSGSASARNSVSMSSGHTEGVGCLSQPQVGQIAQAVLQQQIVAAWQQLQGLTLELQRVNTWLTSPPADPSVAHSMAMQSVAVPQQLPALPPAAVPSVGASELQPSTSLGMISSSVPASAVANPHAGVQLTASQLQNRFLQASPTLSQPSLRPFMPPALLAAPLVPAVLPVPPVRTAVPPVDHVSAPSAPGSVSSARVANVSNVSRQTTTQGTGHTPGRSTLPLPPRPSRLGPSTSPAITPQSTPPRTGLPHPRPNMQGNASTSQTQGQASRQRSRDGGMQTGSPSLGDRLLAYCDTVGTFQGALTQTVRAADTPGDAQASLTTAPPPSASGATNLGVTARTVKPEGRQPTASMVGLMPVEAELQRLSKTVAGTSDSQSAADTQSAAESQSAVESQSAPVTQSAVESQSAPVTQSAAESQSSADTQSAVDPQSLADPQSQTEPESKHEPESHRESELEPDSESAAKQEPESKHESRPGSPAAPHPDTQQLRDVESAVAAAGKSPEKQGMEEGFMMTDEAGELPNSDEDDWRDVDPDQQQVGMMPSLVLSAHALQDEGSEQSISSGQSSPDAPAVRGEPLP